MTTKTAKRQSPLTALRNAANAVFERQCELTEMEDFDGSDNATMQEYDELFEVLGVLESRMNLICCAPLPPEYDDLDFVQ